MRNDLTAKRAGRLSIDTVTRCVNASSIGETFVGEVRAKIRLTNSIDEGILQRKKMKRGEVRTTVEDALVDTGTVRLAIPEHVFKKLGLKIRTHRLVELADGSYHSVPITQAVIVEWEGLTTSEEAAVMGTEVLIGQSILESLDLFVDCKRNRLITNPLHPHGPVMKAK